MDCKRSMLPGFQWGGVRFEFEPANVMENGGDWRFPQETPTVALPGWRPGEGSTTSAIGEDASTSAGCPAIVTSLASASPQKLFPKSSKRSVSEANCGADETSIEVDAPLPGARLALATPPVPPAIDPHP